MGGDYSVRKMNEKIRLVYSHLLSLVSIRLHPITWSFDRLYHRFIPMWWNYATVDAITHFRSRIIIFVIHIYRGLINYNINIHTRSREVQRVNPSSGNTGIAYIRRRKLFLETSSSNIILLHPCLLVYLTTNRILVILGYTNLPIFRIPLHLYFV